MHDEKRPGDVLKVPGDPLDDVADDARYGIYTFITTTEKPQQLVIAEDIRRLAQQGDLTSAAIRGAQMMAEAQVSCGCCDPGVGSNLTGEHYIQKCWPCYASAKGLNQKYRFGLVRIWTQELLRKLCSIRVGLWAELARA